MTRLDAIWQRLKKATPCKHDFSTRHGEVRDGACPICLGFKLAQTQTDVASLLTQLASADRVVEVVDKYAKHFLEPFYPREHYAEQPQCQGAYEWRILDALTAYHAGRG